MSRNESEDFQKETNERIFLGAPINSFEHFWRGISGHLETRNAAKGRRRCLYIFLTPSIPIDVTR